MTTTGIVPASLLRGGYDEQLLFKALNQLKGRTSRSGGKLLDEALDSQGRSLMLIAAVQNHIGVVEIC